MENEMNSIKYGVSSERTPFKRISAPIWETQEV